MQTKLIAKRDTFTTCPSCGESFRQDGIGRYRTYCSDACKMKAHRRQITGKSKRKEQCTIRTDYLEKEIGFYSARKDYSAEEALRGVAREVSAPIEESKIDDWRQIYTEEISRWSRL